MAHLGGYGGTRRLLVGGLAGLLLLAGVFAVGAGLGQFGFGGPPMPDPAAGRGGGGPAGNLVLKRSTPTRLRIPSIGVDAAIRSVELDRDGTIAAPPLDKHNDVGWYAKGPSPGEYGPALMTGHVDGESGPSVFYKLGAVRPGAVVEARRRDGRTAVFRVDAVERVPKTAFPAARLYDASRPGLRLITCGGTWVGGPLGYADNVVVSATLVDSKR